MRKMRIFGKKTSQTNDKWIMHRAIVVQLPPTISGSI